jgi:ribonuclease BN (tRNA processing enzyme)
MTGRQAGEYAAKAGARRLVLTHVPPWNDARRTLAEAASAYDGPIDLARPGLTLDLPASLGA